MHQFRVAVVLSAAIAIAGCASSPKRPLEARVMEYGLYNRGFETVRPDATAPSGQSRGSHGFQLRQTTREVPLVLGTSFGFCYEISGAGPASTPKVVVETVHPSFARPGQPPTVQDSFPRRLAARNGTISDCIGYGFDHEFELVPGTWRFSVLVNGSSILTQEFTAR